MANMVTEALPSFSRPRQGTGTAVDSKKGNRDSGSGSLSTPKKNIKDRLFNPLRPSSSVGNAGPSNQEGGKASEARELSFSERFFDSLGQCDDPAPLSEEQIEEIKRVLKEFEFVACRSFAERRSKVKPKGKLSPSQKSLFKLPSDSLMMLNIQRMFRTAISSVPEDVQRQNHGPHVRSCLELFSRKQWVVFRGNYANLASSLNPIKMALPEWDPEIHSTEQEKDHDGVKVLMTKNVSDEEQKNMRKEWHANLEKRNPVFSSFPEIPQPLCAIDVKESPPFPEIALSTVMVECLNLKFNFGDPLEPMFCTLYLLNIQKKKRVSEIWSFHMTPDGIVNLLPELQTGGPMSRCRSALFPYPESSKSHLFFVFQLQKVLSGQEVTAVVDPFMKDALKPKDRDKLVIDVEQRCRHLGDFTQLVAYSFLPLVESADEGVAPGHKKFQLLKWRNDMSDKGMIETIDQMYYQKGKRQYFKSVEGQEDKSIRGVFGGLFSKNVIPSLLDFRFSLPHKTPRGVVSPTNIPLNPVADPSESIREIQAFLDPSECSLPSLEYVNTLYFSPDSLNFSRHPNSSSRTIALKVKLMDCAKDARAPGLPLICSNKDSGRLVTEQWGSVTYHNKRPVFCNEEVKIMLPASLKKDLHLVVQFYHVKCNLAGKKKSKEKAEDVVQELGFVAVPIVDQSGHLLPNQEETVSVFLNYIDNYLTPGEDPAPVYIDQAKKLFSYKTFIVSTVHCQQENIRKFYKSMTLGTEGGGAHLKKSMKVLREAPPHILERNYPLIARHLVRVICEEKEEYACAAVIALAWITESICKLRGASNAARLDVANSFVLHLLNKADVETPPPAASLTGGEEEPEYVKGLHFKLVRTLLALFRKSDGNPTVSLDLAALAGGKNLVEEGPDEEQFQQDLMVILDHSWLFLALISKSQALFIPTGVDCPLADRFCPEYIDAMSELMLDFAILATPRLNLNVSRFLRDCLRIMEPGRVMELMLRYVLSLSADYTVEALIAYKFLALELFLDYEHVIPLSTPVLPEVWTSAENPHVSSLARDFWQQHPLVGLLLHEVRCCLMSPITKVRAGAAQSLFTILWRFDHDDRFQFPESRTAIADMFFPLVMYLMEFWEESSPNMSSSERTHWMASLLFVLRNCSKNDLLRRWWLNDTQVGRVAFLEVLFVLVKEFEDDSLGVETSFVALAILEDFMGDLESSMVHEDSVCLKGCLKVLDALLLRKQSVELLSNVFLTLRWFVWRFQNTIFSFKDTAYCGTLAYHILKFSNVPHGPTRMQAAALFALMLKLNFSCRSNIARMRLQSTIAISRLAEDNTSSYKHLREVLDAVQSLQEGELEKLFEDLHTTLKKVIHDSERIAEFRFDPEMTEELFFDVSIAYRDSPDLRVTWLENLAKHHTDRKNYDEAAQARILMGALVVQRLMELPDYADRGLPFSPAHFAAVSPVVKNQPGLPKITAAQAAEEGIYQSELFSEAGLIKILKEAIRLFACGGSFELGVVLNEIIFVEHYTHLRHYQALSNTFRQMETFAKQLVANEDSRFFGYYYRVFFVGEKWGELAFKEFIYKEHNDISFVNVIKERLENQFKQKYDLSSIKMLPNSMLLHTPELREKEYASGNLDRGLLYWQLVSVKEYLSPEEAKEKASMWERRFNITRFIYETPFTKGGKSDQTESVEHQYKRKQVVTVESPFPSAKKRELIVAREILEVTPIENAIELLEEKITFLRSLLSSGDPESKLQFFHRELQGALLPMVNAGPLAIARTFLGEYEKYDPVHICRLRETALDFSKVIYFALKTYQRCERDRQAKERQGKEEEAQQEGGGALDFSTVAEQEYEKFKKDVDSLVKGSVGAESASDLSISEKGERGKKEVDHTEEDMTGDASEKEKPHKEKKKKPRLAISVDKSPAEERRSVERNSSVKKSPRQKKKKREKFEKEEEA